MHCQELTHKILIVGDSNVGKSSFTKRYVNGIFNSKEQCYGTIGVNFAQKVLHWSDSETVRLHIWNIGGQANCNTTPGVCYRGASGCVVMFDMTNSFSLLNARLWKKDVDTKAMLPSGEPIPCILLANKCDLGQRCVSLESLENFSEANGFIGYMETSVKDNKNVEEPIRFLLENILKSGTPVTLGPPQQGLNPQQDSASSMAKGCC